MVSELACREYGRARTLGLDTGLVHCPPPGVRPPGSPPPLCRLLDTADIDHNPPGPHRPVHRRVPVPWITPVVLGPDNQPMVWWRMIHRGRLAAAQRDWLCHHLHHPLPTPHPNTRPHRDHQTRTRTTQRRERPRDRTDPGLANTDRTLLTTPHHTSKPCNSPGAVPKDAPCARHPSHWSP